MQQVNIFETNNYIIQESEEMHKNSKYYLCFFYFSFLNESLND